MELIDLIQQQGGICTVQAARRLVSRAQLDALRGDGTLWTPLRGWVALQGVRNDVTWALQLGGVVTCVSAFRHLGLWVPHGPQQVHVRVNRETHSARVDRTETMTGVTLHRMHLAVRQERPVDGVDDPLSALAVATGCLREEEVVAAADSAVTKGLVTAEDVRELAAGLPRRRRRALERVSEGAGSGTESTFAWMLRRAGISFEQQFEIRPKEFVDFLIGRSLVVEIDSWLWHASAEQQAKDRRRDAASTTLGYTTLRFTYEQVLFQPEYVMETVLAVVRRRAHLRAPWG
jgi:very-short-patch-repair endonuclease